MIGVKDSTAAGNARQTVEPAGKESSRSPALRGVDWFLDRLVSFFTSLRLTVVCLLAGMVIVFFGTMAQDPLGLFITQEKFFHSFWIDAAPMWAAIKKSLEIFRVYLPPSSVAEVLAGSKIPVFPGGYLVGGVLLINLIASHLKRFKFSRDKAGIWLTHFGLILLLLGQLLTDVFSNESHLTLREGETRNFTESAREVELVIADTTDAASDKVVAISQRLLAGRREIRDPELPFVVRPKRFALNSSLEERKQGDPAPAASSKGVGANAVLREVPRVTEMDKRDVPTAVFELATPEGSLGTWAASEFISRPQGFTWNNRTYELSMRLRRHYRPFSIQLLQFRHDVYPGSDIPKNFSSRVLLQRPETGEKREVLIYMNNPLRYAGDTYYQASFIDDKQNPTTILEVVHNPSWLTPYFACILVAVGLLLQFAIQLLGFTLKRRTA